MQLRQLGNSEVKVTPIAFGAWAIGGWMWGGAEEKEAIMAIRTSYDLGITTIDTAPVYGFGRSEELIGQALEGIPRSSYQLLSKYGLQWESNKGEFFFDTIDNEGNPIKIYKYASKEQVIRECEDSLRRLKTEYIDLYQIHWPDPTTPIAETMEAVNKLIEQGKILAAGVCNYSTSQVEEAFKTITLASNQVPYSMVRRSIESDSIPQALSKEYSIIAYSPLQRGLLTGKLEPNHQFKDGDTRPASRYFKPENIKRVNEFLNKLKPISDAHNASLSQVVINWTVHRPAMGCVLVGARDEKQVEENAGSLDFKLLPEEITFIDQLVDGLVLVD